MGFLVAGSEFESCVKIYIYIINDGKFCWKLVMEK